MPGKESNLPSRKLRKAVGKNNVRGRVDAGSGLPLYERAAEGSDEALHGTQQANTAYGGPFQEPVHTPTPAYDPAPGYGENRV